MIVDSLKTYLVEHCPWSYIGCLQLYKSRIVFIRFARAIIATDISPDDINFKVDYSYRTWEIIQNNVFSHPSLELSIKNPHFFKAIKTVYRWFGEIEDHSIFIYLNALCNRSDPYVFTLGENCVELKEAGIYYNTKRLYRPTYDLNKLQKYLYRDSTKLQNIVEYCLLNSVI